MSPSERAVRRAEKLAFQFVPDLTMARNHDLQDEITLAIKEEIEAALAERLQEEQAIPRPEDPKSMEAQLKKLRQQRTKGRGRKERS